MEEVMSRGNQGAQGTESCLIGSALTVAVVVAVGAIAILGKDNEVEKKSGSISPKLEHEPAALQKAIEVVATDQVQAVILGENQLARLREEEAEAQYQYEYFFCNDD